jgi:hypothetical protein
VDFTEDVSDLAHLITILLKHRFFLQARWVYCSESVQDLLGRASSRSRMYPCLSSRLAGFEPHELIGQPSLELVHPDEFAQVRGIHYSTITQDRAAVLAYLRLRHKDPCRGYILCAIVSPVWYTMYPRSCADPRLLTVVCLSLA